MTIKSVFRCLQVMFRLRSYEPQKVRLKSLYRWLNQFPRNYHSALIRLAGSVRLVSKKETVETLTRVNEKILESLLEDDVSLCQGNVIYVTTDTAGSSSGVMLNLLRNHGNLERRGAVFLDSKDVLSIQDRTAELGFGAIIYVDDFAGTGRQFLRSRKRVAEYVVGTFSEFFLLTCICEEAITKIEGYGVEPRFGFVHLRTQRPLLEECDELGSDPRKLLLNLSFTHWNSDVALGFNNLATNVVFYYNAPNTTPLILRGNLKQQPIQGILPRYDDLPTESVSDRS